MRPLTNLIYRGCSNMSEPRLPAPRQPQKRRTLRRRLEDHIETLYNRARRIDDFDAASDLLGVLEAWFARRPTKVGRERRINGASLQRARRELEKWARTRESRQ